MKEIILAKYGEIALKGENKNTFEDMLLRNIKRRLKKVGRFDYSRKQSTIYIEPSEDGADIDEAVRRLKNGWQTSDASVRVRWKVLGSSPAITNGV